MRGKLDVQESFITCVRLENMVPQTHILRLILKEIDFKFIDDLSEDLYSKQGRPSIDPQVLVKMMLIGYLFGINSERRLCEEVHLNIAYRWFCGLGIEDKIPNHSTFSKNRHRRFKGTSFFQEMFYKVVEQAIAKGFISGKHISTDATVIKSKASLDSLQPIQVALDHQDFWNGLQSEEKTRLESTLDTSPLLINEKKRSRTDPDARFTRRPGKGVQLAHSDNILVDTEHNIILDVEVSEPSNKDEGQASVDMVERSQKYFKIKYEHLSADSAYASAQTLNGFMESGVNAYVPSRKKKIATTEGKYKLKDFIYNTGLDLYTCPNGKVLKRYSFSTKGPGHNIYKASKNDCQNCPLKQYCTTSKERTLSVNKFEIAVEWAERLRQSPMYKAAQKFRRRIERLFGEAKDQMGLRRAKIYGKEGVREQCFMTAMAQNLKRIIKAITKQLIAPARKAQLRLLSSFLRLLVVIAEIFSKVWVVLNPNYKFLIV